MCCILGTIGFLHVANCIIALVAEPMAHTHHCSSASTLAAKRRQLTSPKTQTGTDTDRHTDTQTHTNTPRRAHTHTHTHTHARTHARTHACARTHARTHAPYRAHRQASIRIHTHTHSVAFRLKHPMYIVHLILYRRPILVQ